MNNNTEPVIKRGDILTGLGGRIKVTKRTPQFATIAHETRPGVFYGSQRVKVAPEATSIRARTGLRHVTHRTYHLERTV